MSQENRNDPIIPEYSGGVVKNPALSSFMWCTIALLALFALNAFTLISMVTKSYEIRSQTIPITSIYGFGAVLFARNFFLLRKLEKRRQLVAQGEKHWMTSLPQDLSTESIPPLPFIIDLKVNWSGVFKQFTILFLVTTIVLTWMLSWTFSVFNILDTLVYLSISVVVSLLIVVTAGLSMQKKCNQQFVVEDVGLTKRSSSGDRVILWSEMRLFAIENIAASNYEVGAFTSKPDAPPVFFEISSATKTIVWQWLRPKRWFEISLSEPTMGYEIYHRQMQDLLATVAVKTGLPLHDLRKK